MEEYVEKQVEERMEQEIEAIFDRLERGLPKEEFRRAMEILADEESRGA